MSIASKSSFADRDFIQVMEVRFCCRMLTRALSTSHTTKRNSTISCAPCKSDENFAGMSLVSLASHVCNNTLFVYCSRPNFMSRQSTHAKVTRAVADAAVLSVASVADAAVLSHLTSGCQTAPYKHKYHCRPELECNVVRCAMSMFCARSNDQSFHRHLRFVGTQLIFLSVNWQLVLSLYVPSILHINDTLMPRLVHPRQQTHDSNVCLHYVLPSSING